MAKTSELKTLYEDYVLALQDFNNAYNGYIDSAVYNLLRIEKKIGALKKEIREEKKA